MRRTRPLSEHEYREEAHRAFSAVFRSDDPFDEPFTPSIRHRAILYPVTYELEPSELQAIATAARTVGDDAFYFSVLERPAESEQDRPYHWFIPLEDRNTYHSLGYPFVLENAIYSPKGLWGMMVSQEQHALVGGCDIFLNTLYAHLPVSEDEQVREFLITWKDNRDRLGSKTDWLPRFMTHVYGPEKAQQLLVDAGLA